MSELVKIDSFEIKENEKELFFRTNKTKYKIPSKMFPLSSHKKARIISHIDSEKLENEDIKDVFNSCVFNVGTCYSNSEKICIEAQKRHIENIEFYSGWIFISNTLPLHHSWVMYKDSVIDGSFLIEQFNYLLNNPLMEDNWRNDFALMVSDEIKSKKPNHLKYIFGEIPECILYVGSPDTINNARLIYNKMRSEFPNHPSYRNGQNINGMTQLQKKIYNNLGEVPRRIM